MTKIKEAEERAKEEAAKQQKAFNKKKAKVIYCICCFVFVFPSWKRSPR